MTLQFTKLSSLNSEHHLLACNPAITAVRDEAVPVGDEPRHGLTVFASKKPFNLPCAVCKAVFFHDFTAVGLEFPVIVRSLPEDGRAETESGGVGEADAAAGVLYISCTAARLRIPGNQTICSCNDAIPAITRTHPC